MKEGERGAAIQLKKGREQSERERKEWTEKEKWRKGPNGLPYFLCVFHLSSKVGKCCLKIHLSCRWFMFVTPIFD